MEDEHDRLGVLGCRLLVKQLSEQGLFVVHVDRVAYVSTAVLVRVACVEYKVLINLVLVLATNQIG